MFLELARPFVPRHASTRLAFKRTNGRAGECASPPLPARPTSNSEERTSHAMKDCLRPRDEKERERERERKERKKIPSGWFAKSFRFVGIQLLLLASM